MTKDHPARRRSSNHLAWIGLAISSVLLQACAQPNAARSGARVYAADLAGGAKKCETPKITPVDNQTMETAIGVGNDGGWCGLSVQQGDSKPYNAGLVTGRPAHGNVYIHIVGDYTRIDYTPDKNYTGPDTYTVTLLPGKAAVRVNVTVTAATAKG